MNDRYAFRLSASQKRLLHVWAKHPVSDWECTRDKRIAEVQGWNNSFVAERCFN